MNEELDPRVAQYVDDLVSGIRFGRAWASHQQADRMAYEPPITNRTYGKIVSALGLFAKESDRHAQIARMLVGVVPLYGNTSQVMGNVCKKLSEIAKEGYFDTISATGPFAGRRSSYMHETTPKDGILLALLLVEIESCVDGLPYVPTIGWCLEAAINHYGMPSFCGTYLPNAAFLLGVRQ